MGNRRRVSESPTWAVGHSVSRDDCLREGQFEHAVGRTSRQDDPGVVARRLEPRGCRGCAEALRRRSLLPLQYGWPGRRSAGDRGQAGFTQLPAGNRRCRRNSDGVGRSKIECYIRHKTTHHTLVGSYRQLVTYRDNRIARTEEFHDAAKMIAFWKMISGEAAIEKALLAE
jgi:hypothetical protein